MSAICERHHVKTNQHVASSSLLPLSDNLMFVHFTYKIITNKPTKQDYETSPLPPGSCFPPQICSSWSSLNVTLTGPTRTSLMELKEAQLSLLLVIEEEEEEEETLTPLMVSSVQTGLLSMQHSDRESHTTFLLIVFMQQPRPITELEIFL
ncbi:hypothetical protein ILYODFUR_023841 [Ilyodon furcidens]|uniref:Leptin receptor n=1 Tax=Ilyodon furcidens TaxID=33524 RepID=A0ABV0TLE4_9TELE